MTQPANQTVYDYSFTVWPDEHARWNRSAFRVFRMMLCRITDEFTETQFNNSREELAQAGLLLGEIERVPHVTPERVR